MRLPVNQSLPLAALLFIAMSSATQARPAPPSAEPPTGPAADYPVTVGEPYTIGKTTWTPSDQLNYDAVGMAGTASALAGVSGAHKTLPLPSYAEVTALDTGRTILVRMIERGPNDNDTLVALSPAALTQLGIADGTKASVRVRRVNPPEVERAALRTGRSAPMRMETPESLLKVLRRKLAEQSPLMPPPSVPPTMPTNLATQTPLPGSSLNKPVVTPSGDGKAKMSQAAPPAIAAKPKQVPAPKSAKDTQPPTKSEPKPAQPSKAPPPPMPKATTTQQGTHVVQVAAFSTRERADKAARALGGVVSPADRLWRVRLGPFGGAKDATSALEKARSAGYRDARIQRAD